MIETPIARALALFSLAFPTSVHAQAIEVPERLWTEVDSFEFNVLKSLLRCQGLTTDHQGNFWFSANRNLSRSKSHRRYRLFSGQNLRAHYGVPWVTLDTERGFLITSQYHHTTQINLYDLQTGELRKQILMSQQLEAIQGGKYWKNHLYMTANDPNGGYTLYEMKVLNSIFWAPRVTGLDEEWFSIIGEAIWGEGM